MVLGFNLDRDSGYADEVFILLLLSPLSQLGHDRSHPNPFQIIIHHRSIGTIKKLLNNPRKEIIIQIYKTHTWSIQIKSRLPHWYDILLRSQCLQNVYSCFYFPCHLLDKWSTSQLCIPVVEAELLNNFRVNHHTPHSENEGLKLLY
jgi:hypothetical protein